MTIEQSELLEISFAPIPADPDSFLQNLNAATITRTNDIEPTNQSFEALTYDIRRT